MSVQILRFSTDPEQIDDVERGIKQLFAAIDEAAPNGIRYLATRVSDTTEFVLLLELADGVPNPLFAIPGATAFRDQLPGWALAPTKPAALAVLGDYRG